MARKRILIIDDEPDVQAVVRGCLEDIGGWDVIAATSGREGLTQVVTHSPDAIVLDMMMPEMDGLAFLKALETAPLQVLPPVIFLTAKVGRVNLDGLQASSVKGVIEKPFDPFLLVQQIAYFLDWQIEEVSP